MEKEVSHTPINFSLFFFLKRASLPCHFYSTQCKSLNRPWYDGIATIKMLYY